MAISQVSPISLGRLAVLKLVVLVAWSFCTFDLSLLKTITLWPFKASLIAICDPISPRPITPTFIYDDTEHDLLVDGRKKERGRISRDMLHIFIVVQDTIFY